MLLLSLALAAEDRAAYAVPLLSYDSSDAVPFRVLSSADGVAADEDASDEAAPPPSSLAPPPPWPADEAP